MKTIIMALLLIFTFFGAASGRELQQNFEPPHFRDQFPEETTSNTCSGKDSQIIDLKKMNALLEKKISKLEEKIKKLEEEIKKK